jgi:hypothetical protein
MGVYLIGDRGVNVLARVKVSDNEPGHVHPLTLVAGLAMEIHQNMKTVVLNTAQVTCSLFLIYMCVIE